MTPDVRPFAPAAVDEMAGAAPTSRRARKPPAQPSPFTGEGWAVWARGDGVELRPATAEDLDDAGVQRALRDGIERGYLGTASELPTGSEAYAILAAGQRVGVTAFTRDLEARAVTVHALAIVPEQRGHAYAAHALLAAERRLARDGIDEWYARVPRGNGHGLYFMLRCGYTPIIPPPREDGTTWFRRSPAAADVAAARVTAAGVAELWPQPRRGRASARARAGGVPLGDTRA